MSKFVHENATVVCGEDVSDAGIPIYVVCIVTSDKITGLQFVNVDSVAYEISSDKVQRFFDVTAPSPMLDAVRKAWDKLQEVPS